MNTSLLLLIFALITPSILGRVIYNSIPKTFEPITLANGRCTTDLSRNVINVVFGFQQRNLDRLESLFWNVSTPSHPSYGQHLGFKELHDLIEPHARVVSDVQAWLIENGVGAENISMLAARDHMRARMSVAEASKLFKTKYQLFVDRETKKHILKTSKYNVPDGLGITAIFSGMAVQLSQSCKKTEPSPAHPQAISLKQLDLRSAPNYVDQELAAIVSSVNAPWPVISYGFLTRLALRCPDGSYADINLMCANGQNLSFILVTAYNYNTKAFIRTDNFTIDQAQQCTSSYNCNFKVGGWGFDASSINYFDISPSYDVPDFTPLYFSFVGQTNTGVLSNNITLPYLPLIDYVGLSIANLKALYGVPFNHTATNPNNTQGIIEFNYNNMYSYYSPADLTGFFAQENLPDYSNKVISTGIPNCDCAEPMDEAQLDIELIMAMGMNITTYFYEDDGSDEDGWIFRAMNAPTGFGLVQSLSWGIGDEDPDMVAYYDIEFLKAGARGISVLASSGDTGVWADISSDTTYENVYVEASNPITSSFVTAVGATMVANNGTNLVEWLCSSKFGSFYSSSMGLSQFVLRPWYQNAAANNYYANYVGSVPSGYDTSKRAYPDVSAAGLNINNYIDGSYTQVSGTSASTPIFAGVVALLNDIRLNAGLPPLGFLNPLLYSLPLDAFNDVVIGDSACVPQYCGPFGFPAAPGYDLPTGLGTPNFPKLVQYVAALGKTSSSALSSSTAAQAATVSSATSTASASSSLTLASPSGSSSSSTSAAVVGSTSSSSIQTAASLLTSTASVSTSLNIASSSSTTASTSTTHLAATFTSSSSSIGKAATLSIATTSSTAKVASTKGVVSSSSASKSASTEAATSSSSTSHSATVASSSSSSAKVIALSSSSSSTAAKVSSTKAVTSSASVKVSTVHSSSTSSIAAKTSSSTH